RARLRLQSRRHRSSADCAAATFFLFAAAALRNLGDIKCAKREFTSRVQDRFPHVLAVIAAHEDVKCRKRSEILPQNRRVDVRQAGSRAAEVWERAFGDVERCELGENVAAARAGEKKVRVHRGDIGHPDASQLRSYALTI